MLGARKTSRALAGAALLAGAAVIAGCHPDPIPPSRPDISYETPPSVPWQTVSDESEPRALDIYWPGNVKPASPAPVLVWFPQGWGGHEGTVGLIPAGIQRYLDGGFVVISVRFSDVTATDEVWPQQAMEVDTAVRWIRANHAELGIDSDRVVFVGSSGGAHLAAVLAVQERPDPNADPALRAESSAPNGIVLSNGPYELGRQDFGGAGLTLIPELLGCDPWSTGQPASCPAQRVADASPTTPRADGFSRVPPTFMYAAGNDDTVHQVQSVRFGYTLLVAGRQLVWDDSVRGGHSERCLDVAALDTFLRRWNPTFSPPPAPPPPADCDQPL